MKAITRLQHFNYPIGFAYYTELLVQLGTGLWWPLKPGLYNPAKKASLEGLMIGTCNQPLVSFAELVHVGETRHHDGSAPSFKLSVLEL